MKECSNCCYYDALGQRCKAYGCKNRPTSYCETWESNDDEVEDDKH